MGLGFAAWLGLVVMGSLLWSAVSWSLLQQRIRRNREGRCAHCDTPLGEDRVRVRGLQLCAACARRSRRMVTYAVRAIGTIVVGGTLVMCWAVWRVWPLNRRGAWLMIGLWGLYASLLLFFAVLSARDARETDRKVQRMERRLTPRDTAARTDPKD
ncbi:MAG TPA: hypothetical protein VMT93_00700 [Gemmatimonadaceae bacterium]|nr:hypothetical protein [Gemmatimonadaceae bacterium]